MQQTLSLGTSSFAALRAADEIYVDKTAMVEKLARRRGKILLIRPRRFGKTLLLSTFESLFRYGLRDFHGLAIEKDWDDRTYPVVRLDFTELKEFGRGEVFRAKLCEKLTAVFGAVGFPGAPENADVMIRISAWLAGLPPMSLVVLVDAYDAPLTRWLDDPLAFEDIRSVLNEFLQVIKANDGCLRFFFMTGVTKICSTGLFSEFDGLRDVSLDEEYGTLLGFTEEELLADFGPYLDRAAEVMGCSKEDLLKKLAEQYGGYHFDPTVSQSVLCPWSLLSFLDRPKTTFAFPWLQSDTHPLLEMKRFRRHPQLRPDVFLEDKIVRLRDLAAGGRPEEVDLVILLMQAGYLSILEMPKDENVKLWFPNQEASVGASRQVLAALSNGKIRL